MEDECGLDGKQKAGGVEKLHHGVSVGQMETSGRLYRMCGEEDEFLREDGAPDDGGELPHVSNSKARGGLRPPGRTYNPYASLCNSCSACIMSCQLHAANRRPGEATYPEVLVQGLSLRLARVASTPQKRLFFTLPTRCCHASRNASRRCHGVQLEVSCVMQRRAEACWELSRATGFGSVHVQVHVRSVHERGHSALRLELLSRWYSMMTFRNPVHYSQSTPRRR